MAARNPFPILDGHNDTLSRLSSLEAAETGGGRNFLIESKLGHLDLPRAKRGGFAGGFFAIFAPDPRQAQLMQENLVIGENGYEVYPFPVLDQLYAQQVTLDVMAHLFHLEAESEGQIKVVRTVAEIIDCLRQGIMAIILHFEGAEAIDPHPQLDALYDFYQMGLRSLGIVWSRPNAFGHGVPFKFPASPDTGPGLTSLGCELVRACNRLGIMLDLAHLNEQGFRDVARLSEAPLIVTHAAVHALCPSTRNLTDYQLDTIKASQGLVGLNFDVADLRPDANIDPDTPLDLIVRHIDYLVEHLDIEGVGFGSDFDDGTTMPEALKDAAGLPELVAALREHGYDDAALRKLTHENWLRVLSKTWH
ncbi:dipeptidase [Dictyobacter arantiisoli]|uniref:Membrane dipeptidase n=1 Tax=Dictyobacter arantiisoli TaxID=2014874 RepID=A0A5A5TET6_9CHLR|nr:dipeptidase [Dictyobacter arantiisoli]GCF09932.1 membrane dipeptidase [Dictyobacter arantiisoli]